jgi:hypothetical protein
MTRRLLLPLSYTVIGLLAFASILHVCFLGDDWMFLDLISRAKNALVVFAPLNARFTRPLIVLVYYFNYRHFGLWTFPAHLIVVLLHIFDAWLVSVFVMRLMPRPNQLAAAGAGLIFLLFAGHSEAISWVAGMADAAIVPFIVGSLLLLDRAIAGDRPWSRMVPAWLVGSAGFLAKETALLLPAFALVYGILPLHRAPLRQRVQRTVVFVGGLVVVCGAYWLFRNARFGSSLAAYSGMGTSEGQRVAIARMFLLRAFVPPGRIAVTLWAHWLDVLLFAALAAATLWAALRERDARPGLAFLVLALFIALGPAFPLSISLVNTLTERYVYLATVFSCALVAWLIVRLAPNALLAAVALLLVAGVQWHYLARVNQSWRHGGEVFRLTVDGILQTARAHPPTQTSTLLLLNAPDTIDRAYVDGAGMTIAVRLMSAAAGESEPHVRIAAMIDTPTAAEAVAVHREGHMFGVQLGPGTLVDGWLRDTDEYSILQREPHAFAVDVKPSPRRTIVAYTSSRHVDVAAVLDAIPFGFVDLPKPPLASCEGETLRFSGWALDAEPGVVVEIVDGDNGAPRVIGTAQWKGGVRPDVAALFQGYPLADRAAWDYELPCSIVPRDRDFQVRVIARDSAGQEAELGVRTIRHP